MNASHNLGRSTVGTAIQLSTPVSIVIENSSRSQKKAVDAAIVTDMLSLAWQNAYDIAVLVTSDADFVPAVEKVQERGLKVVNAGWASKGHELKAACWGSFDLDPILLQASVDSRTVLVSWQLVAQRISLV